MFGKAEQKQGKELQQAAAKRYSSLAGELSDAARPQRNLVADYATGIIKGGPEAMRVAAPQVSYLRRQMATQRQQVRDTLPRGGAQQRAQMRITAAQPGAESKIFSDQVQAALDRLTQLSQYNTSASMNANSGVASVGQNISELGAQKAASQTAAIGGVLNPLGWFLGNRAATPAPPRSPVYPTPLPPPPHYDPSIGRAV